MRIDPEKINELSQRYVELNSAQRLEDEIMNEIVPGVRKRGFYSKAEFLKICYWKTPRTRPRCESNDEELIREATKISLSNCSEQLRIEILTLLSGVSWPTASVFLHFAHIERYPILDFRALWSLGIEVPAQYDFPFWQDYVSLCRRLADQHNVSMRVLDRALWQFSNDNPASS